jgi:hypothetical protein
MLVLDFDNIYEILDSDDGSVANQGRKRKASSPKKATKKKQSKHDDGGPEQPDVSSMCAEEANSTLKQYRKNTKAFTDSQHAKRIQEGGVINVHPYTGVQTSILRTMIEVESAHLEVGHSFKEKYVLLLQIAE